MTLHYLGVCNKGAIRTFGTYARALTGLCLKMVFQFRVLAITIDSMARFFIGRTELIINVIRSSVSLSS